MKDINLIPDETLPPAERAVEYFLSRLANDPELAYLCDPFTGVFDVMMEAACARRGLAGAEAEAFRKNFRRQTRAEDPAEARCERCEKIDPDDLRCSECPSRAGLGSLARDEEMADLLLRAAKIIGRMSAHCSAEVIGDLPECPEEFFDEMERNLPGFGWRKCGSYAVWRVAPKDDISR